LLIAAASARAAEPLRIEYRAGPGCPGREALMEQISGHAGALAVAARPAERFLVEVELVGAGARGRVRRLSDAEVGEDRRFAGATCAEVVDASALAVASSLVPPPPSAPSITVIDPAPPVAWTFGLGLVAAGLLSGEPAGGLELAAARDHRATPGQHVGAPDLRLGVRLHRNDFLAGTRAARVALWSGLIEVCPLRLAPPRTAWLVLGACATGEVGVLEANAVGLVEARRDVSLWAAGGGAARLGIAAGAGGRVELGAGATAPLRRTRFLQDNPRAELARIPAVVWSAALTVLLGFR
jgi:hypothetical protein